MKGLQALPMMGRTLLLMVAALAIAEGIGLTLQLTRPPTRNAPVALSQLARWLSRPAPAMVGQRGEVSIHDQASLPTSNSLSALRESLEDESLLAANLRVSEDRVRVWVRKFGPMPPPPPPDMGPGGGSGMGPGSDGVLGEGFVVAFRRDDGMWRIVESVTQTFLTEYQLQAIGLFVIGMLLLLPMAWLFSRAIAAPVRRFSIAAQRLGNDPKTAPLPLEGPPEMRMAIESFNAMQVRLNTLLQERATMIGAIAHDLRTPLTRLAFRLESLPEPLAEKANQDIQQMRDMISAALEFLQGRVEFGSRERLDFRLLVESVVDDQADLGNDVTLEAGESVILRGDSTALRRMVANLIENALKYGQRARVRLTQHEQVCGLEVDDDGPGIPESHHERVFQPFYRLESSRNRETGGSGLGLATVRIVVLEHGGNIQLTNRPGGGLRVRIRVPLVP